MKPIQALSAALSILTTIAATAAVPAPQAATPGARPATAPQAAVASHADEARPLAMWTYCGMYTRPDGRTGIKCYTV